MVLPFARKAVVLVAVGAVGVAALGVGGWLVLRDGGDERAKGEAPPAPAKPVAITRRASSTSPLRDASIIAEDLKKCRGIEVTPYGTCVAVIGDAPDPAISAMTEQLGAPDADTDWVDAARSPFGSCPGQRVRGVTWDGLTLIFAEGSNLYNRGADQELIAWRLQGEDAAAERFKTRAGITLGDELDRLRSEYGKDKITVGKIGDARVVDIQLRPSSIRGTLDGSRVRSLEGGALCTGKPA